MRIIIAHNYSNQFVSVISWSLANHLAGMGHDVLFFSHEPGPEKPFSPHKNLTITGWPEKRPKGIKSLLFYYKKHKAFKPDVMIMHFAAIFIGGIAGWLLQCPKRFIYYHTAEEANLADTPQSKLTHTLRCYRKHLLYKCYHKIICVSQFATKDIQQYFNVPTHKLEVVYNALPDRWNGHVEKNTGGPIRFHYLGRLDTCKRVLETIAAFNSFCKQYNGKAILCIAGAGMYNEAVKTAAAAHQNIEYIGPIPVTEVDAYIQAGHYLICPSLVETFGMVNAEALMNATPVLASAAGGIPEIVIDGKTGFLSAGFSEQEWVALFEKACLFFKEDNAAYRTMQMNGRNFYKQHFTMDTYLQNMLQLIIPPR